MKRAVFTEPEIINKNSGCIVVAQNSMLMYIIGRILPFLRIEALFEQQKKTNNIS